MRTWAGYDSYFLFTNIDFFFHDLFSLDIENRKYIRESRVEVEAIRMDYKGK